MWKVSEYLLKSGFAGGWETNSREWGYDVVVNEAKKNAKLA